MSLKRQTDMMATFSMASMTDVIFLLLVFFMVTSTFVFPTALDINLPETGKRPEWFRYRAGEFEETLATALRRELRLADGKNRKYFFVRIEDQEIACYIKQIDRWNWIV